MLDRQFIQAQILEFVVGRWPRFSVPVNLAYGVPGTLRRNAKLKRNNYDIGSMA